MSYKCIDPKIAEKLADAGRRWQDFMERANSHDGNFRVVVIGQQNNGKSQLCNALMGDWDNTIFPVKDIRETQEPKEADNQDRGITVVDTPGFGTDYEEDAKKAREQWDRANLLIFVHSVLSGELDNTECEMLSQIHQNVPDIKNRLCVVCAKTGGNWEEYESIEPKIREQIKSILDYEISMLGIDSKDYQEGEKNNDEALIEESGFAALINWIDSHRDMQPAFLQMLEHEREIYQAVAMEAGKSIDRYAEDVKGRRHDYDFDLRQLWDGYKPSIETSWQNCANLTK